MISYKIILIASAIGVFPFFIWFFMVYKNSQTNRWPINFIITLFFIGVLTALPASLLEIAYNAFAEYVSPFTDASGNISNSGKIGGIMAAVIIEEFSKGLGIIYLISKQRKILDKNTGLIIGALVGLAFAITENGVYFASYVDQRDVNSLTQVAFLRYLISTTAHIVYSGFFGYFWGLFLKEKKPNSALACLLIPIGIHFIFNLLLGTPFSLLSIIIIFLSLIMLIKFFIKNRRNAN